MRRTKSTCEFGCELAVAFGLLPEKIKLILFVAAGKAINQYTVQNNNTKLSSQETGPCPDFSLIKRGLVRNEADAGQQCEVEAFTTEDRVYNPSFLGHEYTNVGGGG